MSFETTLQLILVVTTALVGIASIIIAVLTLRQNNKMIESNTRPILRFYLTQLNIQTVQHYLVLKNFGSSSARITNFHCDFDLTQITYKELSDPFRYIIGTELAPGQKLYTSFASIESKKFVNNWNKSHDEPLTFQIELSYISEVGKQYDEHIDINLSYDTGFTYARPSINTCEDGVKYSMHALVQIAENDL